MAKKKSQVDTDQAESFGGSMAVNDAWTGLLAISLLALMIGAGFLLWDYLQYDDKAPGPPHITKNAPGANKPLENKDEK